MSEEQRLEWAYEKLLELVSQVPDDAKYECVEVIREDINKRLLQNYAICTWAEGALQRKEETEFNKGYVFAVRVFLELYKYAETIAVNEELIENES